MDYQDAVRKGAMAAEQLHSELGSQERVGWDGGNIDIFGVCRQIGVPLLLRPLEGILGAYLREPAPGILVTTRHSLCVQRYTAAHELGHHVLSHASSLDNEDILKGGLFSISLNSNFHEAEANALAMGFLLPKWLITWHMERQGWNADCFKDPHIVCQLSLRLDVSFEAIRQALERYELITSSNVGALGKASARSIKIELLEDNYSFKNYHDVWLLTERDSGNLIIGSCRDLFILCLRENCGSGYLWATNDLQRNGFF